MEKNNKKYRLISDNRKAFHDYFIGETYQAGIELFGTEVKSLRQGKCNLKDSYIDVAGGQAYIENMHISPYEQGNIFNKDPLRKRRLLLHKREIGELFRGVSRDGYTIVATKIYFDGSLVKIDVALAKGKKMYDKRDALAKKTQEREIAREMKTY